MRLQLKQVDFIQKYLPNGKKLLLDRNWYELLDELQDLEAKIGFIDNDSDKGRNEIGWFIDKLICKIAFSYGDDAVLEIDEKEIFILDEREESDIPLYEREYRDKRIQRMESKW